MSPWSPPGPEPGTDSAPAPASTPGAGFLPRLDYYLKLAEGPVLPDEGSPDVEGSLGGLSRADTPMVDPQLEPMLHPGGEQTSASEGVPDSATSAHYGRLGSLPNGRTVFHGPTSLLNMYPPASSSWSTSEHSTTAPREPLLPPDQNVIEQQLTDEYFLYDNLFLKNFTRELYLREKYRHENGGQSQLYSPALGHAILAVGALYAEEAEGWDIIDLSERQSARARALLTQELLAPRISSALTLMALCSLSAANGQDSQGWLDSGKTDANHRKQHL
ncbi:hypothetical protein B0T11DRAFT_64200 [Plectosphaerella cucumerina]|uniref:Transcription factor domain-containing protein n=1 Tax=Plectosphaerella cucumerina TaxID=40658 RepID=A0A8K0X628_9PEZI|nr:hypothetical protein B0T11DRAFT_64200 [Plectosphaerella cucumerina]